MEALQFDAQTKILTVVNTEIPKIKNENDLLIKVVYSGVCGTDLHIIQGEFPCKQNQPLVLGHEFCGIVVDVGEAVSKQYKVGDRVVLDPNNGCHKCISCHSGNPHYCNDGGINNTLGIYRDGGWASYCLVPEEQVHKLPDDITFEQGALCEPISCIAHGWNRINPISVGERILIVGAGIIGNLWAVNLHLQGHRRVTISEPNAMRLEHLKNLDLGYDLITPTELKERNENDPLYLFDLIIDCSGYGPAIEQALTLLTRGGKLCIFGVTPPTTKISVSTFQIYMKETSIIGVNINPYTFPKAIGLLEAMGDRYLNYDALGIKVFKLTDYQQAIDDLKKGVIAKAVFKLQ